MVVLLVSESVSDALFLIETLGAESAYSRVFYFIEYIFHNILSNNDIVYGHPIKYSPYALKCS